MELQNIIELQNIMDLIMIFKEFKGKSSSTSKSSSASDERTSRMKSVVDFSTEYKLRGCFAVDEKIRTPMFQIYFLFLYAQEFTKIMIYSWFGTIHCNRVLLINFQTTKQLMCFYSVGKSTTNFKERESGKGQKTETGKSWCLPPVLPMRSSVSVYIAIICGAILHLRGCVKLRHGPWDWTPKSRNLL